MSFKAFVMKRKFSLYCAVAAFLVVSAQQAASQTGSVGIGTNSPASSAILDVSSSNKGVLIPRMFQSQRDAISSPVPGLLIYQTDGTTGFYYYSPTGWQLLGSNAGSGANRSLSNLDNATAVNTHLLPAGSGMWTLGSTASGWRDLYITSNIHFQGNRTIGVYGNNIFFGTLAGNPAITGSENTGGGYTTLKNLIGGNWNTGLGYESLLNANNAFSNTGVGFQALYANTTGSLNTATGALTLLRNAVGSWNTANGVQAGQNLLNGSYNTFVGGMADVPLNSTINNSTAIGFETVVNASNTMRFGNANVTSIGGYVNWTALSDGRFKQQVQEDVPGLTFIQQLRPVTYQLAVDEIARNLEKKRGKNKSLEAMGVEVAALAKNNREATSENKTARYSGFIAQEVEEAAKKLGYRFSGVDAPKNRTDFYGLRYAEFVVPLVKAVQELSQQMEGLKHENQGLRAERTAAFDKIAVQEKILKQQQLEIEALKGMVQDLQKQFDNLKRK